MDGRKLRLRFGISFKQFVLVGIPLAFEFFLIGGLFIILHQEDAARQEAKVTQQASVAEDKVAAELGALLVYADDAHMSPPDADKKVYDQVAVVRDSLAEAARLGLNPQQVEQISSTIDRLLPAFEKTFRERQRPKETWGDDVLGYEHRYYRPLKELSINYGLSLAQERPQQIARELDRQARLRRQSKKFLNAGLVLSLLISVSLAVFFSRSIRGRIRRIGDNNRRFLANQTLAPPDRGSDEVADLDRTFHDVARALVAAREKDRAVEKLKEQVVSMVTHDLRTPLHTVLLTLECIDRERLAQAEQAAYDHNISRLEELAASINNLLDLNKLEMTGLSINTAELHLDDVMSAAYEAVIDAADRKNITIDIQGDAVISADEQRVRQIFVGLLTYAIKHCLDNRTIRVAISSEGGSPTIEFGADGSPDMMRQLHEALDSAREQVQMPAGVAPETISLAICKALMDLHHTESSICTPAASTESALRIRFPATIVEPARILQA